MTRLAILAVLLFLAAPVWGAGADEQYLDVYNEILQGDGLLQGGHSESAALRYIQAQTDLRKLQTDHPDWNVDIVKYRQDYLTEKLQSLEKFLPGTNSVPTNSVSSTNTVPSLEVPQPAVATLDQQIGALQEQIHALTVANAELQDKLKEALSVQPAAVSPVELAKAEAKINELQKERDLLTVSLAGEKTASSNSAGGSIAAIEARAQAQQQQSQAEIARLNAAVAASKQKLDDANKQLTQARNGPTNEQLAPVAAVIPVGEDRDQLKQQLAQIAQNQSQISGLKEALVIAEKKLASANDELKQVRASLPGPSQIFSNNAIVVERDRLKEELEERSRDLADAESHNNQELQRLRSALQKAEARRDELEQKLAAQPTTPAAAATTPAPSTNAPVSTLTQVAQLQAKVAALESTPVPYTPEEQALMKKISTPPITSIPAKTATPHQHTSMELPPGSGGIWTEALRDSMAGNYAAAEKKFKEVQHQDENNVYVLAHLADTQFALGELRECERTLERALSLDPDDAGSLYLFGLLRYRQNNFDDALTALSRSAQLNPTNAATQNFLGCVLAEKGLRPAAESALRKALRLDPENADANFNLAVVYAGNKPPSLELARWHYKKALALGHAHSPSLEKIMGETP